jgi:hypothetical protein
MPALYSSSNRRSNRQVQGRGAPALSQTFQLWPSLYLLVRRENPRQHKWCQPEQVHLRLFHSTSACFPL